MNLHPTVIRSALVSGILGGLLAILVAAVFGAQDYADAYHARTEFGIIEQVTSYLWLLPLGSALGLGLVRRESACLLSAWLCLMLLCRELDLHKLYTLESVSSTRYWRSGEIPLLQKSMLGSLLAFTVWVGITFLRRGWNPFWKALRVGAPWVGVFVGAIFLAAIPVMLDNILDMDALEDPKVLFGSLLEESFEMMVPVLLAAAVLLWAVPEPKHSDVTSSSPTASS